MPTSEITITILIIAAVLFAVVRQVMPQPVRRFRFLIFPIIAAYEAYRSLPQPTIPMSEVIECLLVVIFALVAGFLQARFTRVFWRGNQLYTQGGWASLIAWIILLFVRLVIHVSFTGDFSRPSTWILWTAIAAAFGSRSLVLYIKHPDIRLFLGQERASRQQRRER